MRWKQDTELSRMGRGTEEEQMVSDWRAAGICCPPGTGQWLLARTLTKQLANSFPPARLLGAGELAIRRHIAA